MRLRAVPHPEIGYNTFKNYRKPRLGV